MFIYLHAVGIWEKDYLENSSVVKIRQKLNKKLSKM